MKTVNVAVLSLCVFITCYVDCAAHSRRQSKLVKKDKFSITGEANTHGTKTELNIHVESVPEKSPATNAQSPPPSKAIPWAPPSGPGQGKASEVTPKPNKNIRPSHKQQNQPTSQVTNAASTTRVTSSPEMPISQQPSGVTPTQNSSTPGQQNKATEKVTNGAGMATQTKVSPSPKLPISQKPSQSPGAGPESVSTKSPTTAGKPLPNKAKPTQKKPVSQNPSTFPGPTSQSGLTPTQNPSTPVQQNKPTGKVTNIASKPSLSKVNPSQTKPISQQPNEIPGPTSQGGVTPTQNPSSPVGQRTKPTIATISRSKATQTAQPSSPGKAFQVTPKPKFEFSVAEKMALSAHNAFRKTHQSKPMNLTEDLVSEARKMAVKLASQGDLIHQTSDVLNKINQGESLAKICSKRDLFKPHSIIKHVVDAWYAEVCRYNFQDPNPASKETAHFTQLVWNGSNELGIGVAQKKVNDQYCWFIVARYRPQGNINDKKEFRRNIKRGTFDPLLNNCVDSSNQM